MEIPKEGEGINNPEAIKRGLYPTVEETLEELESKAQDLLREGDISPEVAAKLAEECSRTKKRETEIEQIEKKQGEQILMGLKELHEEYDALMKSEQELMNEIKKLEKQGHTISLELVNSTSYLIGVRRTLLKLYKLPEGETLEAQIYFLGRINETLITEICLLHEIIYRAEEERRKKERG